MDAFLANTAAEAKRLAATADDAGKRRLLDGLRDIQLSLESPEESMQRLTCLTLTSASIRTLMDLKIYTLLSEAQGPLSLDQLANSSKSDPALLARFLRHQSSLGMIEETTKDHFAANTTTRNLSVPTIQAGLYFCNDVLGPVVSAIPDFLAERNYQNPTDHNDTPFHKAYRTKLSIWEWLNDQPRELAFFHKYMLAQRSSIKNCFSFLPLDQEAKGWSAEKPVFVDIGGGTGQQCMALREKFPDLPGRIILQDLPAVIAQANVSNGVEAVEYDFFTPEPIIGAKYYYLRAIMHDHADDKCLEILKNVANAMTGDSTLLLDEIVVPNEKVEWYVTQVDLLMLSQFNSTERTEAHWRELLGQAGLKVQSITTYTELFKLSIIRAVK